MHLPLKPAQTVLHRETQHLIQLVLTFAIALRNHVIQMKAEVCAMPLYPSEAMGSVGEQLHALRVGDGL